jgi:predicted CXXCH cytochrome family protein
LFRQPFLPAVRAIGLRLFLIEESGLARRGAWWVILAVLLAAVVPVRSADIRQTPHNLTKKGPQVEADEVCVFCHTPQVGAFATSMRNGIPIQPAWQPSLPDSHSFVVYDDIGRMQFGDRIAVGSQSIACLSCHDANQAFSVQAAESDHPFGIPYRGFNRGRERVMTEMKKDDAAYPSREARELKSLDEFRLPSKGTVDNRVVWWVSASGVSAVRTRADLPLYARKVDAGDATSEVPYVECSSCHDPHISNKLFLRVNNEGSRLCLTCHDK